MTEILRRRILRAHGLYLGAFGFVSFFALDLRAVILGTGPESGLTRLAPNCAVGFLESHGLAVAIALLFFRARPSRLWHLVAGGVAALLATCNIAFWSIFTELDVMVLGYVSTALHWLFVALELAAAVSSRGPALHAGKQLVEAS
ncbi:MAG TPA: hypothetical protein VGH97_08465 [Thermoanaerobaculia bacterium]|jgi:hypothetical protein